MGEAQLSFASPADTEPLRVGDDEVLVLPRGADDAFNLQCVIESVGAPGLAAGQATQSSLLAAAAVFPNLFRKNVAAYGCVPETFVTSLKSKSYR